MAEALKTFREGEDILASDTNDNNQYLLSKLSDNAAQVQQYVEGEVATIKSNVASVQATLQNNIAELDAKKPIYIVEAYVDGETGYNLYSNGFCEQWGAAKGGGSRSSLAVILPKPYVDTNYNIQITSINAVSSDLGKYNYSAESGATSNKTETGFTITWSWGGRYWRTVGYTTAKEVE